MSQFRKKLSSYDELACLDGSAIIGGSLTVTQEIVAGEAAFVSLEVDGVPISGDGATAYTADQLYGSGADGSFTVADGETKNWISLDETAPGNNDGPFHFSKRLPAMANFTISEGGKFVPFSGGTETIKPIICSGTLTINGTLAFDGADNGVNGVNSFGIKGPGGGGDILGGTGGHPGDSGEGVNPGEVSELNASSAVTIVSPAIFEIMALFSIENCFSSQNGARGSNGGDDGEGNLALYPGDGGIGGGPIFIFAKHVVIGATGVISAVGQAGEAPSAGDSSELAQGGPGGSGGGGGGYIQIVCDTLTNSGSIDVSGGAAGVHGNGANGGTNGTDGEAGSSGRIRIYNRLTGEWTEL